MRGARDLRVRADGSLCRADEVVWFAGCEWQADVAALKRAVSLLLCTRVADYRSVTV